MTAAEKKILCRVTKLILDGILQVKIFGLFDFFIVDHEITLKILEFILNSIEKVKPGFSLSAMCMFLESNGTKS